MLRHLQQSTTFLAEKSDKLLIYNYTNNNLHEYTHSQLAGFLKLQDETDH